MCVSFRNGDDNDTPQTSPFATLECPNSCSYTKQGRMCDNKKDERFFNYVYRVFAHII